MSFWGELRRRNVVKVAIAYAIVAWVVVQIASTIFPALQMPQWTVTFVTLLLVLGFPIALILSWAYELTPEGIKKSHEVPVEQSITSVTGQRLNYIVTVLLALAVIFVVVDNYVLDDNTSSAAGVASAPAGLSPAPENGASAGETVPGEPAVLPNSVAVLPLDNMSPDPDNAYFAAGMHEEILNQLAKLKNLNVISRTSVMQYGENRPAIPVIASELNVGAVLEGSVRFEDNNVLVTAQLIDAATDSHLWSDRYERELAGVFAIQSDIAMNVANALAAEFSVEEQAAIERQPTTSPEAYRLLLQAWSLIGIGEQAPRMQVLLDRALELDPEFAAAHGTRAVMYSQALINTTEGSARVWNELEPLIREHAERALAIDPATQGALNALGALYAYSWRWSEASEAYQRAKDLADRAESVPIWFTAWSGNEAEAVALAAHGVELNPLDWFSHWVHGIALNYAGDHAPATEKFRDAAALVPVLSLTYSWLAMSEVALGNTDAAREALDMAEDLLGGNRPVISLLDIAYGYGRIGDTASARRLFDEISAAVEQGADIGAGGQALAHLAIGDTDEALAWLEQGAEKARQFEPDAGLYSLMNLRMNYTNDPLLERPAFVSVRNRLRGN